MKQQPIKSKDIKIKGTKVTIRAIGPVDYIEGPDGSPEGVPFGLFQLREGPVGMAGRVMEDQKPEDCDPKPMIIAVLKVGLLKVDGEQVNPEKLLADSPDLALAIYSGILALSLRVFDRVSEITSESALFWHTMARDYGKTPMEMLMPNGGYSDLDAYLWNSFVWSAGTKRELAELKKRISK